MAYHSRVVAGSLLVQDGGQMKSTGKDKSKNKKSIMITGAGGYIGSKLVKKLAELGDDIGHIMALDIREPDDDKKHKGVTYITGDIRSENLGIDKDFLNKIDTVVHLAAIVTPGKKSNRELEYEVDVLGTRNVLEFSLARGVDNIIVTSSGAAYGYYSDNPMWLDEEDELRGNKEFPYSDHKRQVEEMLAEWRRDHPELKQLIFRPGVILGKGVKNQITALFDRKFLMGLMGTDIPFVLIWDEDVVDAIIKGILESRTGIYNMAGNGVMTMKEMASIMGKPFVPLPPFVVKGSLSILKQFGLTQYGPEQIKFLRYRPVLANKRLKREFGYTPRMTTREVFDFFLQDRRLN